MNGAAQPGIVPPSVPRLEWHVRMFHAGCIGIVIGPLDDLVCAECGAQLTAFISSDERAALEAFLQAQTAKRLTRNGGPQ
jgi:hypothetical protein